MVKADRRVHLKNISRELGISHWRVYNIVRRCFGYRKVSCQWVPKKLDDIMKGKRMGEGFLGRIVTGDETWILHFTPESKQQSMV
ncbi:unnamed protein product [Ixodes pacificus]